MRNKKLNILTKVSVLSAMAFILYFIEFPLPIFPEFLKLDVSDIPAVIGAFALGPLPGVAVELIKNLLHLLIKGGSSAGIGELANFVVGAAYVYTCGLLYKKHNTRKFALIGLLIGTVVMGVVASIGNYFVFLPLYENVLKFPIDAVVGMAKKINPSVTNLNSLIVLSILPFNLLKGLITSAIVFLIYKRVSPILHK